MYNLDVNRHVRVRVRVSHCICTCTSVRIMRYVLQTCKHRENTKLSKQICHKMETNLSAVAIHKILCVLVDADHRFSSGFGVQSSLPLKSI